MGFGPLNLGHDSYSLSTLSAHYFCDSARQIGIFSINPPVLLVKVSKKAKEPFPSNRARQSARLAGAAAFCSLTVTFGENQITFQ